MLVPGLQTASLSKMTSGSKVDYSRVYELLADCAQKMLDKYNQKQVHTGKLEVKVRAVNILLHELKKMPKDSGAAHETVLFALKSHAEALQGHEHLLSKKGNTYALIEQTRVLRDKHDETPASLLRYHDLKNKLLGPDTTLSPELKEAMSTRAENKTLTLQTLVNLDELPRTEENFSPQSRLYGLYRFFTRNLEKPPDKEQWSNLSQKLNRLASVLKTLNNHKWYLEIIWRLKPSDRNTFLDVTPAAHVIAVFPSLIILKMVTQSYSQQKLKALLIACLHFKQGNPSIEDINSLFVALLEAHLPLYWYDGINIPAIPACFLSLSGDMAMESYVTFIPVMSPIETAEKLALHFVDAVISVLRINTYKPYHCEASKLKIETYKGEIHSFPVPELQIQDKGIKIRNWSTGMFQLFLAVTRFPKCYYVSQEQ